MKVAVKYVIPMQELEFRHIRSPGPGGQNVNKVATAVELRFDVNASNGLPLDVKQRMHQHFGNRISKDGVLVISAHRYRSQERNRQDAIERLLNMIASVAAPPTPRRATKPTRASRQRRVESKQHRAQTKQQRQRPGSDD